jgi:N-acetylneuraminate synthase
MNEFIDIADRRIGTGYPCYIVAELSGNHGQDFDEAVKIIYAAKEAGADAVKLQTYTPETLTIECEKPQFRIKGSLWYGRTLYDLYSEAFTPWEWQPRLREIAQSIGLELFSTPFDASAVEFLETMGVPAYKIASFENCDVGLLQRVAATGKPVIASTGMATLAEIEELVTTVKTGGGRKLALLKCTSAYPAPYNEMNIRTIPHLQQAFGIPVGLSDHSLGIIVPVTAVTLGACMIEKHLTLSRSNPGPDSAFSLEPDEFKSMVDGIRIAEKAVGRIDYGLSPAEGESRLFRRSLFVVRDIHEGDIFTEENVRSIRPGFGLHTRHMKDVLGRKALRNVERGTPMSWDLVGAKCKSPVA